MAIAEREAFKNRREADQQARKITPAASDADGENWIMLAGKFQDRMRELPDAYVDAVVTDPPYNHDSLQLWSDLAKEAKRVLVDQGLLIALMGSSTTRGREPPYRIPEPRLALRTADAR